MQRLSLILLAVFPLGHYFSIFSQLLPLVGFGCACAASDSHHDNILEATKRCETGGPAAGFRLRLEERLKVAGGGGRT